MNRTRIRTTAIAVFAVVGLVLSACGSSTDNTTDSDTSQTQQSDTGDQTDDSPTTDGDASALEGAKIAFLMPDHNSTRYEQHDSPGFEKALNELCSTCEMLYNNADGDATTQQQQFDSALSQGVKGIVIDPVDSTAAASLVQKAQAQGVPVVSYDRPIPDATVDFYVSFDNQAIGKSIAESLVQYLQDQGVSADDFGIIEVNGSPTDAAAGLIRDGIHEGIASGPYETLAEFDTPDWVPAKAQEWVAGQITQFRDKVGGVVAANDGTAGGAIAALKAANVDPLPPVTGNDATDDALQRIISGDQYNTISKPSEIVGAAAARVITQLIAGEEVQPGDDGEITEVFGSPTLLFVPKVITKDNIKAEIFDTGIASAADICTSAYAAACAELGIN